MPLAEHDHVVEALPPDRADNALDMDRHAMVNWP
jgi:hypothetical protein